MKLLGVIWKRNGMGHPPRWLCLDNTRSRRKSSTQGWPGGAWRLSDLPLTFLDLLRFSYFRRTTFIGWPDPCPGTGRVSPGGSSGSGSIGRLVQGVLELLRFHRFGLRRACF